MTTALADSLKTWTLANPLRRWREEQKLARQTVAAFIGVSVGSVVAWEAGTNSPTADNLAAIAGLMGVKTPDLAVRWDAWKQDLPRRRA